MNSNDIKIPLQYKIRYPEQKTQNKPSLFLLHGFGSNMEDLFSLNQFFPNDWNIISLQAPKPTGFGGWSWTEVDLYDIKNIMKAQKMYSAKDLVISSIKSCIFEMSFDSKKVHLIGFSQGATLALICGLTNPNLFQGIASLCGFLDCEEIKEEINHNELQNLNTLVTNGTMDDKIPIELGRMTEKSLKKLGVESVYKEYNMGHTISNECLNDLLNWIHSIQK